MLRNLLAKLQWLFLPAVAVFAWLSFKDDWLEISSSLGLISSLSVALSIIAVAVGLLLTGIIWVILLAYLGHPISYISAQPIFFVGQLGKYIPGSVWAIGAQAKMAKKCNVPIRVTVATGTLFLYVNLFSSVLLGAFAAGAIWPTLWANRFYVMLLVLVCTVMLSPFVMAVFARKLKGDSEISYPSIKRHLLVCLLMTVSWSSYGIAIYVLIHSLDPDSTVSIFYAISTFAISYAAGLLVVISPAGVGVREAVLILGLSPFLGFEQASAIALLIRLIHTFTDFGLAGFWFLMSKVK
jgi:uncharacterized membrane protein YbhN (UPF0104 family)